VFRRHVRAVRGAHSRILLYSSPPTGDQAYYLIETISLVQDGDFNVANNYAQHDENKFYALAPHPPGFVGISAPYPLPPQLARATNRPSSEWYGYHLPGLSFVLAPAWIVGSWFALWWLATMVLMCAIGALVAVNMFLLAYETTGRLRVSVPVWLGLAFSSPLMTYTYLIFTELPTGLLVIYAFRRLELGWAANSRWRFLVSAPPGATVQERPSDAQVGPDGLLYVLNNGEGGRALLVLGADGHVVRQIPLEDRSNITMGLTIGPDGQMHVADMVGGRIVSYGATGGKPTSAWGD